MFMIIVGNHYRYTVVVINHAIHEHQETPGHHEISGHHEVQGNHEMHGNHEIHENYNTIFIILMGLVGTCN